MYVKQLDTCPMEPKNKGQFTFIYKEKQRYFLKEQDTCHLYLKLTDTFLCRNISFLQTIHVLSNNIFSLNVWVLYPFYFSCDRINIHTLFVSRLFDGFRFRLFIDFGHRKKAFIVAICSFTSHHL